MGVYIKGMEIPETGVYEIAVDNTWGKVKPIMTLYTRKDNGMLHVFGSYELLPVPPHGLIAREQILDAIRLELAQANACNDMDDYDAWMRVFNYVRKFPTIIPADGCSEQESQRDYEASVECAQHCERYEPTYDPETGAM